MKSPHMKRELFARVISRDKFDSLTDTSLLDPAAPPFQKKMTISPLYVNRCEVIGNRIRIELTNISGRLLIGLMIKCVLQFSLSEAGKRKKHSGCIYLKVNDPIPSGDSGSLSFKSGLPETSDPIILDKQLDYYWIEYAKDKSAPKQQTWIRHYFINDDKKYIDTGFKIHPTPLEETQYTLFSMQVRLPSIELWNRDSELIGTITNSCYPKMMEIYVEALTYNTSGERSRLLFRLKGPIADQKLLRFSLPHTNKHQFFQVLSLSYQFRLDSLAWEIEWYPEKNTLKLFEYDPQSSRYILLNTPKAIHDSLLPLAHYISRQQSTDEPEEKPVKKKTREQPSPAKPDNMPKTRKSGPSYIDSPSRSSKEPVMVNEIQVLDTSYNHVNLHHPVHEEKIELKIWNPAMNKTTIPYCAHYCEKCDKYFDFETSFVSQLKEAGIPVRALRTALLDFNDRTWNTASLDLKKEHVMHYFGYQVGSVRGLADADRQRILDHLLDECILSASQVKDHLEFLIRYNGKRKNMSKSVRDWTTDIKYINKRQSRRLKRRR